jgi:hypothetical protein
MSLIQAILSRYGAINPLVGLSSTALRLYGALEVFRDSYQSPMEDGWFRAPRLDKRLQQINLSKWEIQKGFAELINAGLLKIRTERNTRWFQLK